MKRIVLFSLLVFLGISSHAQLVSFDQYMEAADTAFLSHKDYYNASVFYEEALRFQPSHEDSMQILSHVALSAYYSWDLTRADTFYTWLDRSSDAMGEEEMFLPLFYHGKVYMRMGEYELAKNKFEEFIEKASMNDVLPALRVDAGHLSKACTWAKSSRVHYPCVLAPIHEVNECDQHQLAPVFYGDDLLFTSYSYPEDCIDDYIHQVSAINKLDYYGKVSSYIDTIIQNTLEYSSGFLTFNQDYSRVYYSRCVSLNSLDTRCQIVSRGISPSGEFDSEERVELGATAGLDRQMYTYSHPNVGWDTTNRSQQHLYFVSDLEGGKGGLDIWVVPLDEEGRAQKEYRENISVINTSADEVSPFFHSNQHRLYYSSNNYEDEKSYGGFDIYKTARSRTSEGFSYGYPNILRQPINTSKHDIFYILSPDTTRSVFSSNRTDPYKVSCTYKGACCYNIFETDCETYYKPIIREYCSGDTISRICLKEGIDRIDPKLEMVMIPFDTAETKPILDECGRFKVVRGKKYWLYASREGYLKDSLEVEVGRNQCGDFSCSIFLKPKTVELLLMVSDKTDSGDSYLDIDECNIAVTQNGAAVPMQNTSPQSKVL